MHIGRYEVWEEIGKGSMGIVYKARDPHIDRLVALKVLRRDRVTSDEFVQRFLKEARAIGRLSHRNIVVVYDSGQEQDTIYIAMELLRGRSLRDHINDKRFEFNDIVSVGVQVAEALDYAHRAGIVHRDIKPSNIIIAPDKKIKITDFGIARIEDPASHQQTQAGDILGTPAYMSPEQVAGQPVDGRSDLYSLGVILYELFTGSKPFEGKSIASIFKSIIDDAPATPLLTDEPRSRNLSALIMKSMSKLPDDRYQSGVEMANVLKGLLQRRKSDTADTAPRKQPSRKTARLSITLLMSLAVVIAAVFWHPWRSDESLPVVETVLQVKSNPPGAQVFLNGSLKGAAPIDLGLPLGKYEVRLSLPNHYEWEGQLHLKEEGAVPLSVRLVPIE
jgi:serine/threonine protein kinase